MSFYVVDGMSHLFRAYHAVGYLSTSKGVPSHAVLILSTMLWKLIREERPDYLTIAWDPPGPTFRDALYADYKATRASMPDDLARQIPYVRRLFEAIRTPVVEVPGYEADDVIATLVDRALAAGEDVVIVTGDKDMLQLVGPRVRVLSVLGRTGERIVYDEAKVRERWGVEPAQIADVLALMGDAIDNIPGVRGIGEKTAVKLVNQFGGVERLYENLSLVAGKLRETLAALAGLARAGAIESGTATDLADHYRFLRRVSAALRLLSVRPSDTIDLAGPVPARTASALGYPSRDAFLAEYRKRTAAVRALYNERMA